MGRVPLQYVLSRRWENDFSRGNQRSFYRMVSYAAFRIYFEKLYAVYTENRTLEDALLTFPGNPMQKLCAFLGGVRQKSAEEAQHVSALDDPS